MHGVDIDSRGLCMRVSLRFVLVVNSGIERLEPLKWRIAAVCCGLLIVEFIAMLFLTPFVSRTMWLYFFVQIFAFFILLLLLRRRRSLRWRARRLLKASREPGVFLPLMWWNAAIRFRNLSALFSLWSAVALLIWPFYARSSSLSLLGHWREVLERASPEFFGALWQVHATVLGVFLVILTFVFQFVSLRSAYETSLLPFLAHRVRLAPLIIVNFCFVGLEMLPSVLRENSTLLLLLRYIAVLGFFFSVLSAVHLLLRVLELL